MAAGDRLQGRRRDDTPLGQLPDDIRPGDYWRVLHRDGEPMQTGEAEPTNLTGGVWTVVAPLGEGYGIGRLVAHTVREHDDGTISVRPGDGSSNSILISRRPGRSWHGYIEHGVWEETA